MIGRVEKAIVDLPIKMKGNSKPTSGNSLSPLGPQNKNIVAAWQTLLTEIKFYLRRRLIRWQSDKKVNKMEAELIKLRIHFKRVDHFI